MRMITLSAIIFALLLADARADEPVEAPFPKPILTVQFVNENGNPLEGVRTGYSAIIRGYDEENGADWDFRYELRSNAHGIVHFREPAKYRGMVFARHAKSGLLTVKRLSDWPYHRPVTLTMHPGCHIIWSITCEELEHTEKGMGKIRGLTGSENVLALWMYTDTHTIHAVLPPGEFTLVAAGERINPMPKTIVIAEGQQKLKLCTDVVAKPWTLLIGEPAPEITDVADWKNGPPVQLSDLRGKVVLLDFWGWWCGPCIYGGIPELMKLHEEYSREELVIIGIHTPGGEDDDINTAEELEEQLSEVRRTEWNGKEIPFPVAITRYRKLRFFPEGEPIARTRTCVDYGVTAYPTCIVIDRAGNVWGTMDARSEEDRAKLRELIKGK